jgi:uncharacterized protein (DUF305 family)
MLLFSRKFVRKRAISLATTASVAATSFALAQNPSSAYHVHGVQYVANRPGHPGEQAFSSKNDADMNKMKADMVIKPTGDVDRDFAAMMVPHHHGAIDMARGVLRYGHNEQLHRLAREIVVTQQQEIAGMRRTVGEKVPPPSGASPTEASLMPSPAIGSVQLFRRNLK